MESERMCLSGSDDLIGRKATSIYMIAYWVWMLNNKKKHRIVC